MFTLAASLRTSSLVRELFETGMRVASETGAALRAAAATVARDKVLGPDLYSGASLVDAAEAFVANTAERAIVVAIVAISDFMVFYPKS